MEHTNTNKEQSWCQDTYEDFPKDGLKPTKKITKLIKPIEKDNEKERSDTQQ